MKHLLKTSLMAFAIMTGASLSYAAHGGDEARLNTRRLHTPAEAHDFAELLKQVRAPGLSRMAAQKWLGTHGYAFNAAMFTEQKGMWTTLSSGFRAGTVTLDDLLRTIGVSEVRAAYSTQAPGANAQADAEAARRPAEEAARRAQAQAQAEAAQAPGANAGAQTQSDAARQRRERDGALHAAEQDTNQKEALRQSQRKEDKDFQRDYQRRVAQQQSLDAAAEDARRAAEKATLSSRVVKVMSALNVNAPLLLKLAVPQVVNGVKIDYVVLHPNQNVDIPTGTKEGRVKKIQVKNEVEFRDIIEGFLKSVEGSRMGRDGYPDEGKATRHNTGLGVNMQF